MPDYWVYNNAMGWHEKGVLTEEDLAEISQAIEAQYTVKVEVVENEENLH